MWSDDELVIVQRRKQREASTRKRNKHKAFANEFVVVRDFPQILSHNRKYGGALVTATEQSRSAKTLPKGFKAGHGSATRLGFDRDLTSSSLDQFQEINKIRKRMIKPKRDPVAKRKAKGTLPTSAQLEAMTNEQVLDQVLLRFRKVAEEALQSGADLRGFQGEAMNKTQFKERMRSQFNLRLHPREVDIIVGHFDKDGDELIDYVEVHGMFMNPERLQRASAREDTRAAGRVLTMKLLDVIAEKKRALEKKGQSGSHSLETIFKKHDLDGSGTVTRDEFGKIMEAMEIRHTAADVSAVFNTLEKNGDGDLSYGEFQDMYNQRRRLFGAETEKGQRMKEAFKPAGCTAQARGFVSDDRKTFLSSGDPYVTKLERDLKYHKAEKTKRLAGEFVWSSESVAKASIQTKAFMSENLSLPRLH
jgi:Ca2+-binding EF-hand superfamily protein